MDETGHPTVCPSSWPPVHTLASSLLITERRLPHPCWAAAPQQGQGWAGRGYYQPLLLMAERKKNNNHKEQWKMLKLPYSSQSFLAHNRFTVQGARTDCMGVQILFNTMMYKQSEREACAAFVSSVRRSEVCFWSRKVFLFVFVCVFSLFVSFLTLQW